MVRDPGPTTAIVVAAVTFVPYRATPEPRMVPEFKAETRCQSCSPLHDAWRKPSVALAPQDRG